MSKSTVKGIKKTADFWDKAWDYTIGGAGKALGHALYKLTPGHTLE